MAQKVIHIHTGVLIRQGQFWKVSLEKRHVVPGVRIEIRQIELNTLGSLPPRFIRIVGKSEFCIGIRGGELEAFIRFDTKGADEVIFRAQGLIRQAVDDPFKKVDDPVPLQRVEVVEHYIGHGKGFATCLPGLEVPGGKVHQPILIIMWEYNAIVVETEVGGSIPSAREHSRCDQIPGLVLLLKTMADHGMVTENTLDPEFLYQFQRDGSFDAEIPGNLIRQRQQRIEGLIYLQVQFSDFVAGNKRLGSDDRSFERFGRSFGGFDQLEFTPVVFLDPTDYANKIQPEAVFNKAYDIALDLIAFVADEDVLARIEG